MQKLNLPPISSRISRVGAKVLIFDMIRKKFVALTPEEWVRQHFVHYLIGELHCPKALIRVESGMEFNKLKKRTDVVVFDRTGGPWMLVECKAPEQKIDEAAVRQASVYNTVLQAPFMGVTNGLKHYCYQVDWANRRATQLGFFPAFETTGNR